MQPPQDLASLRAMSDDDLKKVIEGGETINGRIAPSVVYQELQSREAQRREERMLKLSHQVTVLTWIIAVFTAIMTVLAFDNVYTLVWQNLLGQ